MELTMLIVGLRPPTPYQNAHLNRSGTTFISLGIHPDCPTTSAGLFSAKQVEASIALVATGKNPLRRCSVRREHCILFPMDGTRIPWGELSFGYRIPIWEEETIHEQCYKYTSGY